MIAVTGAKVALAMAAFALLLTTVRLLRGPDLANRVVALDLLSMIGVGVAAGGSVVTGQDVYLDVALVLALITFLGTVAFARYSELGGEE